MGSSLLILDVMTFLSIFVSLNEISMIAMMMTKQ